MLLWEDVDDTRWRVVHDTDLVNGTVVFWVTDAPPPWASPELAAAMTGALQAVTAGHCGHCEAVPPPPALARQDDDRTWVRWQLRHAPWCPWSGETVDALHEACRPPAVPGYSDREAEEDAFRLGEYLALLEASLRGGASR